MTTIECLNAAWEAADAQLKSTAEADARREFALAKTAIEDAQMRYTRGRAMALGVFAPADLDRE